MGKYVDNCQTLLKTFYVAMAIFGKNFTVKEFLIAIENEIK